MPIAGCVVELAAHLKKLKHVSRSGRQSNDLFRYDDADHGLIVPVNPFMV